MPHSIAKAVLASDLLFPKRGKKKTHRLTSNCFQSSFFCYQKLIFSGFKKIWINSLAIPVLPRRTASPKKKGVKTNPSMH